MKLFLLSSLFISSILFGQSKKEILNEISMLKIENNLLREKVQIHEVKIATLETELIFIQKQIDDLKLKNSSIIQNENESSPKNNGVQPHQVKQEPVNNGQCQATTQKGTRCSRNAKPNGFCFQHGGN